MNEAQTRFNKIDPKLRDAGWGIVPGSKILVEQSAYIEYTAALGPKGRFACKEPTPLCYTTEPTPLCHDLACTCVMDESDQPYRLPRQ